VPTLGNIGRPISPIILATFRNWARGMPVIRSTISGV
jgi:hypothetical protein